MGADGLGATADPAAAPLTEAQTIEKFKNYVRIKEKREATAQELAILKEKITPPAREKTKVELLKERIEAREKALREGNAAQELGKKVLSNIGGPQAKASFEPDKSGSPGSNSDVASNPELVQVPAASKLSSGYAAGPVEKPAKTWPTKPAKDLGALQGAGASQKGTTNNPKIKESEELEESKEKIEECDDKKSDKAQLNEAVKDVTSVYVDQALNTPKLNFARIKESLAQGILG
jgi:hypothetical protein